jgi:hypothetical protein
MATCFHRVGNFPWNKLILKIWLKRGTKISEQPSVIKLEIPSRPTHFDGLRRRISCLTSESEIEGTFKKSENVERALFGIATEESEWERERVKNRRKKTIRKGFENTLRLCYYIFTNFELSDNKIILFKLRNVFAKVLSFSFRISTNEVCFNGDFNQFAIIKKNTIAVIKLWFSVTS